MSAQLQIQEDKFDEDESGEDEPISFYEDDVPFNEFYDHSKETGIQSAHKRSDLHSHLDTYPLSTIAEESCVNFSGVMEENDQIDPLHMQYSRSEIKGHEFAKNAESVLARDEEFFIQNKMKQEGDAKLFERWTRSNHDNRQYMGAQNNDGAGEEPRRKIGVTQLHLEAENIARKNDLHVTLAEVDSNKENAVMKPCVYPNFSSPKSFMNFSGIGFKEFSPSAIWSSNSPLANETVVERGKHEKDSEINKSTLSSSVIENILTNVEVADNGDALLNALMRVKMRIQVSARKAWESSMPNCRAVKNVSENIAISQRKSTHESGKQSSSAQGSGQSSSTFAVPYISAHSGALSGTSVNGKISEKLLECDYSAVYFGFVEIGCKMNRSIKIRNISSKKLNLMIKLKGNNEIFRLCDEGITVLQVNESHEIKISFKPSIGACFRDMVQIKVINAVHIRYSIPIIGSGGVANIVVRQRAGVNMLRDGSYVLSTQGYSDLMFVIENNGVRDAFVRVAVTDCETMQPVPKVKISPSEYLIVERHGLQECFIGFHREDCSSSRTSSRNEAFNFPYCIQLLWGEEGQRRRLKRYENEKRISTTFDGLSYTIPEFLSEKKSKRTSCEDSVVGSFDRDVFELALRIIRIEVIDNRVTIAHGRKHNQDQAVGVGNILLVPDRTLSQTTSSILFTQDVSHM